MNRPLRAVVGVVFWAGIAVVLSWPVLRAEETKPCRDNSIDYKRDIEMTLDRNGSVPVPAGWSWTRSPGGEHFVLGIAASTNPCAVDDIVEVTSTSLSVRSIDNSRLGRDDAFIEVAAVYMPMLEDPPPRFPAEIEVGDLEAKSELWDAPIYSATAGSVDDYARYSVVFWVGPNASSEDRAGAERALTGLRLR